MRTPRAVNSLIDNLFERKYRNVGQEKKPLEFFSLQNRDARKGSKYREFYDLSGLITCMHVWVYYMLTYEPSSQVS